MASANGVTKEISMAKSQNIPVFGIYIGGANTASILPRGLPRSKTIAWDWKRVASMIDLAMTEGTNR